MHITPTWLFTVAQGMTRTVMKWQTTSVIYNETFFKGLLFCWGRWGNTAGLNLHFHSTHWALSSYLKSEMKSFSSEMCKTAMGVIDKLCKINKKTKLWSFYRAMDNFLIKMRSEQGEYTKEVRDLTSPWFPPSTVLLNISQAIFSETCQVKFTLCFLSAITSKETLMECILTRHRYRQNSD